jgi:lipopolysaccharide export system protein LptC
MMLNKLWRYLTIGLLISLGIFSLWYLYQAPQDTVVRTQEDWYVDNIQVHRTSADGDLATELTAAKAIHHPQQQLTDFMQATLTLHQAENAITWQVTAPQAMASENFTSIQLTGGVHMQQHTDAADAIPSQGYTEAVTIYPEKEQAHTEEMIQWDYGDNYIQGVGMSADMQQGVITLLNQVQARLNTDNPSEQQQITSQQARFYRDENKAEFLQQVKLTQAEMILSAARLVVYTNAQHQAEKSIATGNPLHIELRQADSDQIIHASANQAVFDLPAQTLTLHGQVQIQRDGTILNTDKFVYNTGQLSTGNP